jgi:hypothetical protein
MTDTNYRYKVDTKKTPSQQPLKVAAMAPHTLQGSLRNIVLAIFRSSSKITISAGSYTLSDFRPLVGEYQRALRCRFEEYS